MFKRTKKVNAGLRAWAAVAFAGMVIVNGLANILPLNGKTTGAISDSYANLFAPAGFTFSIWSVIYILLAAYTLYQINVFHTKQFKVKAETIEKITPLFIASSVFNIAWIFAWHYEVVWLSVLCIAGLLVMLAMIVEILRGVKTSPIETMIVKAPFSVYFGWITVATIANITTWLVSTKWDGGGVSDTVWTVVILIIGAVLGTLMVVRNRDFLYGAVLVWSYFGILVKHASATGWAGKYPMIIGTLWALLVMLIVITGLVARKVCNK